VRRILAIALFSGLAMSGHAQTQAPAGRRDVTGSIDSEGRLSNVRLVLSEGVVLRAERLAVIDANGQTISYAERVKNDLRLAAEGKQPGPIEYVLSGEVKLTFPGR
jgi:hypothetical protein